MFKMTSDGTVTTLYSFCAQASCDDGLFPMAGLIQASNGNFYGTTSGGGVGSIYLGTVFEITSTGVLSTLVAFDIEDGAYPYAALVQGTDGNLYGATVGGGPYTDPELGDAF